MCLQTAWTVFIWFYAKYGVAVIMRIVTCPCCNWTNTRFCRKSDFVANTRFFGFVLSRLLRRHLGFDSDFAQISEQKIGGWGLWGVRQKGGSMVFCHTPLGPPPPRNGLFSGKKLTPIFFLNCIFNCRNKLYTWSHFKNKWISFVKWSLFVQN